MARAQREATRPRPAGPDAASARVRVRFALLLPYACLAALAPPAWGDETTSTGEPAKQPIEQQPQNPKPAPAQKWPAHKAVPESQDPQHPHKTGESVRLPAHRKGDAGKVANTSGLHGDSKIEEATVGVVPEEHMIVPIAPAPFVPAPAETSAAPMERLVVPVEKPAATMDTEATPAEKSVAPAEKPTATAEKLAATAVKLAAIAEKLAATAVKLAATAAQASAAEASQPAHGESPSAVNAPKESTQSLAAPTAAEPVTTPKKGSGVEAKPETVMLDEAVFDQIRLEIKSRLPYFQACAEAARRRGSSEVRRVQATWTIAADGTIKDVKVEGVPDPLLATCITRMGRRPFAVQPGTELTIPTPIVFVR